MNYPMTCVMLHGDSAPGMNIDFKRYGGRAGYDIIHIGELSFFPTQPQIDALAAALAPYVSKPVIAVELSPAEVAALPQFPTELHLPQVPMHEESEHGVIP